MLYLKQKVKEIFVFRLGQCPKKIENAKRCLRETAHATEGVTLSGFRKEQDRRLMAIWRIPLRAGAEGESAKARISQAKGQNPE